MTDLARVVEDALEARTVPYSPDAAVYVVDSGAPEAIVAALVEAGWTAPSDIKPICDDCLGIGVVYGGGGSTERCRRCGGSGIKPSR